MIPRTTRTMQIYRLLLAELRAGTRRPGGAISVREAAERFRSSPTPVREALERLVGEGMVTPFGDRSGYAVPRFGTRGYQSLIDAFTVLAQSAGAAASSGRSSISRAGMDEAGPAEAIEAAFEPVFVVGANSVTTCLAQRLSNVLAPYRALEPLVLPEWQEEMLALRMSLHDAKQVRGAIRAYARRRHQHAAVLVELVEQARRS